MSRNAASLPIADLSLGGLTRIRGESVSRIEAFSDGVYAFAVTLLVLSLEVPQSFSELLDLFRGLPAFAICFAILVHSWYQHHRFFRRYGLDDAWTVTLNAALLFILVLYLYPMKFMFTVAVYVVTGVGPMNRDIPLSQAIQFGDVPRLFLVFGLGFGAVNLLFFLMNLHAWTRRDQLCLTPVEQFDNRSDRVRYLLLLLVPSASILICLTARGRLMAAAGWVYFFCGFIEATHAIISANRRHALAKRLAESPAQVNPRRTDAPDNV